MLLGEGPGLDPFGGTPPTHTLNLQGAVGGPPPTSPRFHGRREVIHGADSTGVSAAPVE